MISLYNYEPDSLKKIQKFFLRDVVLRAVELYFVFLTNAGIDIFRWIWHFNNLSNQEMFSIVHLFVFLNRQICLIDVDNRNFWVVYFFHVQISQLIFKIAFWWPYFLTKTSTEPPPFSKVLSKILFEDFYLCLILFLLRPKDLLSSTQTR